MVRVRHFLPALVGALLWGGQLSAQEAVGSIRGTVVDSTSQQPLSDVTVSIPGTRRGTFTAKDGTFLLTGVPTGVQRLRATRIGHAPQFLMVTVTAGSTTPAQFALAQRAVTLETVVATGYGAQRRLAITGSRIVVSRALVRRSWSGAAHRSVPATSRFT